MTDESNNKYSHVTLKRITGGHVLANLLAKSHMIQGDHPELNPQTREPVAELLQNLQDYMDIMGDMSAAQRIEAEKTLADEVSVLAELGLNFYAGDRVVYMGATKEVARQNGPMNCLVYLLTPDDHEEVTAAIERDPH